MPNASHSFCQTCLRPVSRCLCAYVQSVNNKTPVFILQHSKERLHPKGTAKLAQLCLKHCQIICDKSFDETITNILQEYSPILLWPQKESATVLEFEDYSQEELIITPQRKQALIVLDGTWKKANKIYLSHASLQALPHLNIQAQENQYLHRKSPSSEHLSSLEAIYYGLTELDQVERSAYAGLLAAQQEMIKHWQERANDQPTSHKQS